MNIKEILNITRDLSTDTPVRMSECKLIEIHDNIQSVHFATLTYVPYKGLLAEKSDLLFTCSTLAELKELSDKHSLHRRDLHIFYIDSSAKEVAFSGVALIDNAVVLFN